MNFHLEQIDPVSLLIGLVIGLVPVIVLMFWRAQARATFSIAATEALRQSGESFLLLAEQKLKHAQGIGALDLDARKKEIAALVDPVNLTLKAMDEKLQGLEKERLSAYIDLRAHIQNMAQDQNKLRQETSSLVQALRSPSTRGQWGEMQLKRCLEMAGLKENVHYQLQVSTATETGNLRPDVIVKLSGGKTIVIDSKAPIEAYLDAMKDGAGEDERKAGLERHAAHVRGHMKALGQKAYHAQFDTPEFVVMFLPGESYFSAALERDPSLIEFGVDQKVIPATPTTLISMLKAVMYGWRQEQLTENAKAISALGRELYERVSGFSSHMGKVGKGLGAAVENYNKAVSTLETRVLVTARKFEDLHVAPQDKQIENLIGLEQLPKALTAPETNTEPDRHLDAAE